MKNAKHGFYLLALFLILSCVGVRAQENAVLTGTVTDPTGAVVPTAAVTIINTLNSQTRTATANGAGLYQFPDLNSGTYTLKVSAAGFKVYEKTGIVMNVAATVREDVQLAIGTSNQTITVAADALSLQTETNEVSNLISGQQITELATNGRSHHFAQHAGHRRLKHSARIQWRRGAGEQRFRQLQRHAYGPQRLSDRRRRSV